MAAAARNIEPDPNGEGHEGGSLYSDGFIFLGIIDDVESVLLRLRRELKRRRGGRGGRGGGGDYGNDDSVGNGNSIDDGQKEEREE